MDFSVEDKTEDNGEKQYREFIGFVRGIESNIENLLTQKSRRAHWTDEDERWCEVAIKTQKSALIEGCRRLKRDEKTE
ncbi:hypothetical protein KP001_08025 [Geomonas subterranea]|uniref:Uncharacterized protein n=1 Tax=Geomonas subterranea TaxID=2847989 RepID=A0ABX8LPF2_9BACT|nr:hypothetical protein [Geomonas subterranea]QXE92459.1 hypothetical protein KP001_08025 [Geomonas subterranea]QXM09442.1 hypothetical protein KP002_21245 [Geomonas subterranea]